MKNYNLSKNGDDHTSLLSILTEVLKGILLSLQSPDDFHLNQQNMLQQQLRQIDNNNNQAKKHQYYYQSQQQQQLHTQRQINYTRVGSEEDQTEEMQTNSYVFSVGFLVLILLYILVVIYMATKLKKQRRSAKIMFGTLLLYMVIRLATLNICMLDSMNVIDLNNYTMVYHLTMNSIFICDCIFVISFFTLFRFFLMYKYYSHISLSSATEKPFFENPKWFILPLFFFLVIQITMAILFNTPFLGIKELMIDDCIQNLLIITCYVVFHVFLVFKFSGTPYLTNQLKKNTRIMMGFAFYFAISRSVIAAVNIYLSSYESGVFDLIQSPSDTLIWKQFLLIASLLLTEIIPFAAICNKSALFQETFQEPLLPQSSGEEYTPKEKTSANMDRSQSEEISNCVDIEDLSKAQLLQNNQGEIQPLFRVNGMGKIYESCNGKAIRKIEVKQISQYILDEINADINAQKEIPNKRLVRILECQPYHDELMISYPYYKNYSLRHILYKQHEVPVSIQAQEDRETFLCNQVNENGQFTLASKINLSLKIAQIIRDLHRMGFVHGHLHSNNILLNHKLRPRVSDLGLNALKKYLGFKGLYSNKSQFTSPENFMARGPVISTNDPASDTYSYAYILYEIFVGKEPFQNLSQKDLKEIVVNKESRPKIPSEVPEDIQKLIRCCWYQRAADRPNFDNICEHLENYQQSIQLQQQQYQDQDMLRSNLR